jgi:hypothetical protein
VAIDACEKRTKPISNHPQGERASAIPVCN